MRATLNELMDKMGVGYVPGAYETVPWSHTDSEKGVTCSAEIRMGMDLEDVEAEIQMLYDNPPPGKGSMEQVCSMRCAPVSDGAWTPTTLMIQGAPFGKDVYDWEEKACLFFQLVVKEITLGNMPNIDDLLDEAFMKTERFAGQRGGSSKSPKIKPGKLLNPGQKGGRGF